MKQSESQSLAQVFDKEPEAELEPDNTTVSSADSQHYEDPIESAASLEYGADRGSEVAQSVNQYVSQFDSLEELRSELSRRDTTTDAAPLENIYQGDELNCSARTAAQVAFSQIQGEDEGQLNVQYDTLDVFGVNVPGNIPVDNHVCYEDSEDITPFDFGNQPNTEVFPEDAIVGIRAANLLTEADNPQSRDDLSSAVRSLAEEGDSTFVDGFMRAYKLDSMASSRMPDTAHSVYESITSKFI